MLVSRLVQVFFQIVHILWVISSLFEGFKLLGIETYGYNDYMCCTKASINPCPAMPGYIRG